MADLINPEPEIFAADANALLRTSAELERERNEDVRDPVDALEVYHLLRTIKDPEHPNTLEQLRVIQPDHIVVDEAKNLLKIRFTPTVPHCSMTTLIGLCIVVKLQRCMPKRFKVDVTVSPGTHEQEVAVNKQLRDKERIAAALEKEGLVRAVEACLTELDEEQG